VEPSYEFFVSNAASPILMPPSYSRSARRTGKPALRGGTFLQAAGAVRPRGVKILAFVEDKENSVRRKQEAASEQDSSAPAKKKKRTNAPAVGNALKSVYQQTVSEEIPPEMLDLLGKLG
jgi:hypothetical protein